MGRSWLLLIGIALTASTGLADALDDQLARIARAGPQGAGSVEARLACDELAQSRAGILPRLLAAMETDNPVAANWYRAAYETIVAREAAHGLAGFPAEELRAFVVDARRAGRVRRLALALCERIEPGFSKKLIPGLLDDPEFRGEAVEHALASGQQALESGDSETARDAFLKAFDHSRDSGQSVRAADKLAGLGEVVSIAEHLGLVTDWWLVGPFDAPGFSGFERAFPPEDGVDTQAEYSGQDGRPLKWIRHRAADPLGLLNLVQALAPAKEAVGYAYAELNSPSDQQGELRCGADDNCTVWLNDQKVFGRNQWLNGIRLDRFVTPVRLKQGMNRLLVKICQGPQHVDPQVPNNWSLQLRFCDTSGRGLSFRSALPEIVGAAK